jgi:phage terminase large subunit
VKPRRPADLRAWATVETGPFRFGPRLRSVVSASPLLPTIHRSNPDWSRPLRVPARYKGASGGRASGKSHFFAEQAVADMVADPSLRFVCIREVQRSLQFSAKSLVELKIDQLGVSHLFDVLKTEIRRRNGSGVMIFEGMQDHTAESIKSLEGFGRAWVEEAQSISEKSLNMLLPTIRAEGSEIWFSWNPDQPTDPVDQFFASKPPGACKVHTTYLDNPFCPAVMHAEARAPESGGP